MKKRSMALTWIAIVTVVIPGCSRDLVECPGSIEAPLQTRLSEFSKRYSGVIPDERNHQRALIHLGLPGKTTITLWYALAVDAKVKFDHGRPQIGIDVNNVTIPHFVAGTSVVYHAYNPRHRTGRIDIGYLSSATTYKISVRGITEAQVDLNATTRPDNDSNSVRFLASSCFQPFRYKEPYGISLSTVEVLRALHARSQDVSANAPHFSVMAGDQIYVDPGAELKDSGTGTNQLAYLFGPRSDKLRSYLKEAPDFLNELYRLHFGLYPFDGTLKHIPSIMMWDDHDIRDGWGSQGDEWMRGWRSYGQFSQDAFQAWQAARNPNFPSLDKAGVWIGDNGDRLPSHTASSPRHQGFSFDWGMGTFFIADSRTVRNFGKGIGLGDSQLADIRDWVNRQKTPDRRDLPRVLVFSFPVPLAGMKQREVGFDGTLIGKGHLKDDSHDRSWSLPDERLMILRLLADHVRAHPNHSLLLLTGDVHYTGIQRMTDLTPGHEGRHLGYEIICSGLAQTEFGRGSQSSANFGSLDGPDWQTQIHVRNHGALVGPCFAEILLAPVKGRPVVTLMFYPGSLPDKERKWSAVRLDDKFLRKPTLFHPCEIRENSVDGTSRTFHRRTLSWLDIDLPTLISPSPIIIGEENCPTSRWAPDLTGLAPPDTSEGQKARAEATGSGKPTE